MVEPASRTASFVGVTYLDGGHMSGRNVGLMIAQPGVDSVALNDVWCRMGSGVVR